MTDKPSGSAPADDTCSEDGMDYEAGLIAAPSVPDRPDLERFVAEKLYPSTAKTAARYALYLEQELAKLQADYDRFERSTHKELADRDEVIGNLIYQRDSTLDAAEKLRAELDKRGSDLERAWANTDPVNLENLRLREKLAEYEKPVTDEEFEGMGSA